MKLKALLPLLLSIYEASALSANAVNHSGTKVFRVSVRNRIDERRIRQLVDKYDLDLWTHKISAGHNADVAVPAQHVNEFKSTLLKSGILVSVMHEDLAKSIHDESEPSVGILADDPWFQDYHPYKNHTAWLKSIQAKYPDNSEIVSSGQSEKGEDIVGIHIWGTQGKGGAPAAIFHGNVHAREWITSKVVEFFATKLIDPAEPLRNKYDYYIFPIVNPDGFVYSQTTDRMKRKNLLKESPGRCSGSSSGTDINRNWDYMWGKGGGASTNPCAEDYQGTAPRVTKENKGLAGFIDDLMKTEQKAKVFIDWHSYSQMIMSPWGYTCRDLPKDNDEFMKTLMPGWSKAIAQRYGTQFEYGPGCQTIYPTTGDSTDYTYGAAGIKYSFSIELRDTGRYGFILPKSQIQPSCDEAWDGLKYMLTNTK